MSSPVPLSMSPGEGRDRLMVVIPAPGSSLRGEVHAGSGMVASEVGETGRLRVDFEGDQKLYERFVERVKRAAERHGWSRPDGGQGYPTTACAYVDQGDVEVVGCFKPKIGEIEVFERDDLKKWLRKSALSSVELSIDAGN